LLEVVLALTIVVVAAAVIYHSYRAAVSTTGDVRRQMIAENLAISKLSEVRLGLVDAVNTPATDFQQQYPDRAGWMWQLIVEDMPLGSGQASASRVTVRITDPLDAHAHRLTCWLPADTAAEGTP
jgi:type II secretory pathway pseudopilin PulG